MRCDFDVPFHRRHHLMGRHHHHGRHGFGRFGSGFADDSDPGGRGMSRGRKLSSGDLQLLVLALLAEKPRHGYEIIKELDERSKGFYSPSPGMIYPALTYLEEIGYATVEADGSRKLYHITESGKARLEENRSIVDSMFAQFERVGERMEHLRRAFSTFENLSADLHGSKNMQRARRELKSALREAPNSPEEEERVAAILRRAAAEIRNKPTSGS
jgi:DNA-binding PadR family transcriptional regulator